MPAAASSPVRQQKYLAHNALPSTRDHSHHPTSQSPLSSAKNTSTPATHPSNPSSVPIPLSPENLHPPATHRRQRDWTVASIGSQHPISQTRDSAKAPTSRTIPASAGPAPRSPPRNAPSDLKSQSPNNPSPAKTHPPPDHTPASAGLDRSEHWIEAPYFSKARQRESPTSRTIPASAGPTPQSHPKNAPAAQWKSCKPQLVNRIDPA